MSKLVDGGWPGDAFMALLKSWGAPDHLISFHLSVDNRKLVEVTCTYYPEGKDGELLVVDDRLVTELKRFRLVAPDDEA